MIFSPVTLYATADMLVFMLGTTRLYMPAHRLPESSILHRSHTVQYWQFEEFSKLNVIKAYKKEFVANDKLFFALF